MLYRSATAVVGQWLRAGRQEHIHAMPTDTRFVYLAPESRLALLKNSFSYEVVPGHKASFRTSTATREALQLAQTTPLDMSVSCPSEP